MKRPIPEIYPFKILADAINAIDRTGSGIMALRRHGKPLHITITWKDIGWTFAILCAW